MYYSVFRSLIVFKMYSCLSALIETHAKEIHDSVAFRDGKVSAAPVCFLTGMEPVQTDEQSEQDETNDSRDPQTAECADKQCHDRGVDYSRYQNISCF